MPILTQKHYFTVIICTIITFCNTLKDAQITDFDTLKQAINGLAVDLAAVETDSASADSSQSTAQRLNKLVGYLENWVDAGNLSMNNIRQTVGEDQ